MTERTERISRSGGSDLESRYRRLLAWYPWSHRRVYEDEMLAVLVAGARPGQRRPTVRDTANLVASGLRARVGASVTSLANPAWVHAATVVGLLAALVLLSQRAVHLLESVVPEPSGPIEFQTYLRAAGWAAVVLAIFIGARRPAAALAWATALGEAVLLAGRYRGEPVSTVHMLWPVMLGVTAAAALSVPAPRRCAVSLLRAPRLLTFVVGIGLMQAIVLANAFRREHAWIDFGEAQPVYTFYGLETSSKSVLYLWLVAVGAGALSTVFAALTLPRPVWLRIAVLLSPVVTLEATVQLTLGGWSYSNGNFGHPIYLVPVQWTLLVAIPLATLALGALLVQQWEDKARLTALGRAADRERLDTA